MSFFVQYPATGGANPSVGPTGSLVPSDATFIAGQDPGGLLTPLSIDGAGDLKISATALPLPAGAATEAKQDAEIALLTTIDTNVSSIDTKVSTAAKQDAQTALLTTSDASLSSIDAKVATAAKQDSQTALLTTIDADTSTLAATVTANKVQVDVISSALPTGAATSANQVTANASLSSIDSKLTAPLSVTGPLTDAELRASAVPVSVASMPLPTGAATEAKQDVGNSSLSSIDTKIPASLTVTATRLLVDGSGVTQPISAASLPLPTGAATEATLSTLNGKVTAVDTGNVTVVSSALPTGAATSANQVTANASLSSIDSKLSGTLAVSGPLTDAELRASAVPVSASSLPLPTGAATSANQTTANSSLSSIDGKLNSLGQKSMTGSVPVVIASDQSAITVTGSVSATNPSVSATGAAVPADATFIGGSDGTNLVAIKVSASGVVSVDGSATTQPVSGTVTANAGSGTFAISAAALPLPTGAATSANQVTANASLSSIDSKLTSPLAVTGPLTDTELRASAVPVSAASLPLPTGAATEATLSSLNSKVTAVDTGNVTVSSSALPTGAATSANQVTANASLASIDSKLTSPITVTGTVTASNPSVSATGAAVPADATMIGGSDGTNLKAIKVSATGVVSVDGSATTQPVSGTVTANAGSGTFAVSAAALPLPAGAATETTLVSIDTKLPANLTVTSTRLLVDGSGVTQPVSASSLPLPTGAATAANQTTANSSLSSIDGKLNSLGQKAMTGSVPVVIASDQSAISVTGTVTASNPSVSTTGSAVPASATFIGGSDGTNLVAVKVSATGVVSVDGSAVTQPVSASSLPLPTGAATSANQTTANSSLSSIDGKLNSLGQKAMAASAPVVIASDQSAIPVTMTSTTITGTVAATQSGTWTVQPGNTANTTAWLVDSASKTAVNKARNDYTSVNVTTSAYTQLIASTSGAITEIEIFDSSGQTLVLATGAASSEVDQIYITPGGNGRVPLKIAASTRVSIKAVSATANAGEIVINFYG